MAPGFSLEPMTLAKIIEDVGHMVRVRWFRMKCAR